MPVRFHPLARVEIDEAVDHYRVISPRLANRLRDELDDIFQEIAVTPTRWAYYEPLASHKRWRRRLMNGFPYLVIYEEVPDGLRVVAVSHAARRPGSWRNR